MLESDFVLFDVVNVALDEFFFFYLLCDAVLL
jgi:hypothetical protein